MHIVSVNTAIAKNLDIGNKTVSTGIFKEPRQGGAMISSRGVEGDTIVDTAVHGGEDQAVYLYSAADYQWWSELLGRELAPGMFGENLTVSAFPQRPLRIGDQLQINGNVHLEITAPRIPCVKFATKMADPIFVKKFVAAERPGAYARVLAPGLVCAGDTVSWQLTDNDYATVNEVFIEWHRKNYSVAVFQKALNSPISKIARAIIEGRYLNGR
ncbi:MAG TPA: MOSC domain-containing protein [Spongiibacteraceae bacterium]|nr:MOSC domain-containing protein [Spongiibacteraceae bacterium]